MAIPSPQSIEILLRVTGGPAIEPDGAGSYRCEGPMKLDSEQFGPSALRVHLAAPILESIAKGAGSEDLISADAMERMFLDSLYGRMRAAGAEPDEDAAGADSPSLDGRPLAFSCGNVLAAENAALDFLSLAFGDQAPRIDLWQIGVTGDAALVLCGPLAADQKDDEVGAVVHFSVRAPILDETTGDIIGFSELKKAQGDFPARLHASAVLSQDDLSKIDRALPAFVGPLPGARLDAIAALLGERFATALLQQPGGDSEPVFSWRRRADGRAISAIPDQTPIFDITIASPRPENFAAHLRDAAADALGGMQPISLGHNETLATNLASDAFHKSRMKTASPDSGPGPAPKDSPDVSRNRPGPSA